jgi:integrase
MAINPKDYPNNVDTGLKANKNYTKFYYRFKQDKSTYKGVIDYTDKTWDKKTRVESAKEAFIKAKKERQNSVDPDATVNDIVKLYMATLPDTNYKKNRRSYYDRKVAPIIGKAKAKDILPKQLQQLINNNIKNGDSPRTAKQTVEVLSPAFRIARANRILEHNPCNDVKITMPKSKKIVVNASERLKSIYEAIMKLYKHDPYYRAFFLLALQGRRKGEVINLRWENISFEFDYYFLPDTKNDEEQKIYLPPNVKEALEQFRKDSGWVFESPVIKGQRLSDAKKQTAKLKRELGDWFTMHYTRNVMVSAMAEQGVDAIYMSGALGHNDPNTITKYLTMNYLQGSKIASDMIQS